MKRAAQLKEFAKYSSMNVLGMIGLSCYILADTYFVANGLGTNGLAALNLAIPVYSFIHGSGLMIGMGGATRYCILRNQNKGKEADRAFANTVAAALFLALVFVAVGAFFSGALARALGAGGEVFAMCKTYLQVTLLFAPAFLMNNVLLCFVRNDGAPQRSMAAMIAGSLSNIVLDYVFVFPLNMGMFGAVFATGLAPVISMLVLLGHFIKRKNGFHLVKCPVLGRQLVNICSLGLPSLVTEVSAGVVMIVFNTIMLGLRGNVGVAAYGIIANLSLVVSAVYTGIAQGIQPILSRNHALGDQDGVKSVLRYALIAMAGVSAAVFLTVFFGAAPIAAAFNSERDVLLQSIAQMGLKIYFVACACAGFNILVSAYFTSTENARPAHIISMLRGFVVIIPMAYLLSSLGGVNGVWASWPATELLVALIGMALYAFSGKRAFKTALN